MKQTILTAPNAQKSPKIAIRVLRNMATIGNSSDDVDSSHIYKYNVSQKTNNHRHLFGTINVSTYLFKPWSTDSYK